MGNQIDLEVHRRRPNGDAIQHLKDLLALAETGDLQGGFYAVELADGGWRRGCIGNWRNVAGAIAAEFYFRMELERWVNDNAKGEEE